MCTIAYFRVNTWRTRSVYRPQCAKHQSAAAAIWAHVCGSDLVRGADGTMYVLEDNLRVPSGVSYMLENRQVVKRVFPEVFEAAGILPVDDYPSQLFDMLRALALRGRVAARSGGADPGHLQLGIF